MRSTDLCSRHAQPCSMQAKCASRACHVDVQKPPGGPREHVFPRGIARTSHFRCTCLREVCRGNSDDDLYCPTTRQHAIYEGLWPSPNTPWSFRGFCIGVRSAPVSLMSTSQRPRGGPREHVIYEGSRAHPIFAALACVKCVEETRMTILVGR